MGFAEALSDDGSLTGRGRPYLRGVVCGLMTFAGAIGHALPYLIPTLLACHVSGHGRGRDRIDPDRLDPQSLHGQSLPAYNYSGLGRRDFGLSRRILIGSA